MSDLIILEGMEFMGKHGCTEEERSTPQPFIIDLAFSLDLSKAGQSDQLTDTIDYVEVFKTVESIVTGTTYNLIEALATHIADTILGSFELIDDVKVTVHKPAPPVKFNFSGAKVCIFRKKVTNAKD